jgi:hypothetical protein
VSSKRQETGMEKVGRNAPCPCGSGRKYKHCCLDKKYSMPLHQKLLFILIVLIVGGGLIMAIASFSAHEPGSGTRRVWSEEHQHWH